MRSSGLLTLANKKNYALRAFLLGILFSSMFFVPLIIFDKGCFLYYGDFNVQQIPFYQMIHDAVRSGDWTWSHTTDLGANTIASYSFYMISSPFFWLTIPFPSDFVPYLMGPMLILKFGCAALTAYIFLKRYVIDRNFAVLGALLYAFSGFSVYNVFFNHFHEPLILFPLLLWAVDEYMINRRRGVVLLTVFLSCTVNYYFFVGQVVFIIIYWAIRTAVKSYRINFKAFLILAFEVLVGFIASCFILLPTILTIKDNPRLDDPPNGWGAVLYYDVQRYAHIIINMLFPPDIPARANFTPDSNANWASISGWLPVFGVIGTVAFIKNQGAHWLKKIIGILLVIVFVPAFNSIFQLFNFSFYTRWMYMLCLMCCLATVSALQNPKTDWKKPVRWVFLATLAVTAIIGFMPVISTENNEKVTTYGLMKYPDRFWISVSIAILSILVAAVLIILLRGNRKRFHKTALISLACVTFVYSGFMLGLGKAQSYDTKNFIIPYALNKGKDTGIEFEDNFRSDFYESMDNMGMFWQVPTIQAFQSIVPGSVMEFYPMVGVRRDVASRPEPNYYGLRSLLSCKYLFDQLDDDVNFITGDSTVMPGYKFIKNANGFGIYENEAYIPMGFAYDNYISDVQFEDDCSEYHRHLMLLKAMVLSEEQLNKYSDITQNTPGISDPDFMDTAVYSNDEYLSDCKKLRQLACSEFKYEDSGFTAKITLDDKSDRLVFFSVPYEDGWSATVNGEKVDIEKVNVGFMAVKAKKGMENTIRFDYETPGLKTGLLVTGGAILTASVYLILTKGFSVPQKKRRYLTVKKTVETQE